MLEIMVSGCNGKMGKTVCELIQENPNLILKCGYAKNASNKASFPIYNNIDIKEKFDVIIDFSAPDATLNILKFACSHHIPVVIATTGFSEDEELFIKKCSKEIPIFKAANMSYGIMLMKKMAHILAPLLKDFDIEITDTHHHNKTDSPSGTAQMLADEINNSLNGNMYLEFNRHDKCEKRNKYEIGMHSIRGGNVVGEHLIQFFGPFETLELKHTAYSRKIFAEGAIKAAQFLIDKPNGMYNMENIS